MVQSIQSSGTIYNVSVSGTIFDYGTFVGGLVGESSGLILNSHSDISISSNVTTNIGGLVALNDGVISNSYSTGSITATHAFGSISAIIGGLASANRGLVQDATITNSYSIVSIALTSTTNSNGIGLDYSVLGSFIGGTSFGAVVDGYATGTAQAFNCPNCTIYSLGPGVTATPGIISTLTAEEQATAALVASALANPTPAPPTQAPTPSPSQPSSDSGSPSAFAFLNPNFLVSIFDTTSAETHGKFYNNPQTQFLINADGNVVWTPMSTFNPTPATQSDLSFSPLTPSSGDILIEVGDKIVNDFSNTASGEMNILVGNSPVSTVADLMSITATWHQTYETDGSGPAQVQLWVNTTFFIEQQWLTNELGNNKLSEDYFESDRWRAKNTC